MFNKTIKIMISAIKWKKRKHTAMIDELSVSKNVKLTIFFVFRKIK